ncbi:MAG TPA: DICT sensory domain-containing protein [Pyrinomonadaceae bacterium]|nr:DICT sensory domain-containing protein [Pyrinomonadaceae bacterium]
MKDFSMYDYAFEAAAESSAIGDLGDVFNLSRRDFDERGTFVFRSQVPCLEYISLLIENAVLLRTNRAGRIYAGFEKLSRMKAVVDRYLRIADISERVYVFGEADWTPPRHPNMRLISVAENSKLSREWFVIADSPSVRVALVAHEEDGSDTSHTEARWFRALKTSDPALIAHFAAAAEDLVDASLAA